MTTGESALPSQDVPGSGNGFLGNSPLDLALAASVVALLLILFVPTLYAIGVICWEKEDYSHGLLLPFVTAYMIWDRRDSIRKRLQTSLDQELDPRFRRREHQLMLPVTMLVAGIFLHFLGVASGISFTSWIAFFPITLALVHLMFGRTAFTCLCGPIVLLFMAKPLPDSLVTRLFWPLQVLAAKVSAWTLAVLGVPVHLSGNTIEIPEMQLLVEQACSGMRSVMALLTLAFIVNYFIDLSMKSKIILVLMSVLVAVVLNVVRVAATGVLAHFYDPAAATGFFHTFSGMIVFIVGLPILYFFGTMLLRIEGKLAPPPPKAPPA